MPTTTERPRMICGNCGWAGTEYEYAGNPKHYNALCPRCPYYLTNTENLEAWAREYRNA